MFGSPLRTAERGLRMSSGPSGSCSWPSPSARLDHQAEAILLGDPAHFAVAGGKAEAFTDSTTG